jgi:hypothetical protein
VERKKEHEWRGRGTSAIDHSPASTNGRTVKPAAANTRAALMAPLRNCPRRMWPKNVASARVAHGCTPSVTTAVKRRNVDGGGGVVAEVDVDILWVLCVVERGWLLLAVGFGWLIVGASPFLILLLRLVRSEHVIKRCHVLVQHIGVGGARLGRQSCFTAPIIQTSDTNRKASIFSLRWVHSP